MRYTCLRALPGWGRPQPKELLELLSGLPYSSPATRFSHFYFVCVVTKEGCLMLLYLTDLPISEVLHTPFRAALDCQDLVYCPHLRIYIMVVAALLPQQQLLCLFWYIPGLLWSICHLQLPLPLLRVLGWRRQYHERDQGETHQVWIPLSASVQICFFVLSNCCLSSGQVGSIAPAAWQVASTLLSSSASANKLPFSSVLLNHAWLSSPLSCSPKGCTLMVTGGEVIYCSNILLD